MRVLVTGITGFLGSHLARALVTGGHEVHGLRRRDSALSRLADIADRITFHDADERGWEGALNSESIPGAIVHLATCYGRDGEADHEIARVNTLMPLQLLERALHLGVSIFISADTCFSAWPIRYKYLRGYTLSKRHFAEWGQLLSADGRLSFVNLKLQHPFGPGDATTKFVPQIIRACVENSSYIDLTPGEQKKDFIYVDDVIDALLCVLGNCESAPKEFREIECGSGKAVSIRAFVETVHRLTRSRTHLRFGALSYRENEIMFTQADTSALRQLGWSPRFTLEQGLREILRRDYDRA